MAFSPSFTQKELKLNGNILIKPSVQQKFDSVMQSGRILFFSAPCGFGKTALANALLRGHRTLRLCADAPDFTLRTLPKNWDVLLIDDFQLLQEQETSQMLCELIRANPARRFVFLSRGVPPSYLTAFQYTGLMTTLEPDDLLFDREDIRGFFAARKAAVTESEINGILKESIGYPLGVAVTARCMSGGKPFAPEIVAQAYREVFSYFEDAIYRRSAAFCWSCRPLSALIWKWREWSAATPAPEICWTGYCTTQRCCVMTMCGTSASGRSSAPSFSGRWKKNAARKIAAPFSAAGRFTTS